LPTPEQQPEDTASSSSSDYETAQENAELNQNLADLGMPPLVASATPISVVFEETVLPDNAPSEPIPIQSDTEEVNTNPPAAGGEQTTLPEVTTPASASRSPTEEINPNSALVIYSGLVISQAPTIILILDV
jgi:hypothetical protein